MTLFATAVLVGLRILPIASLSINSLPSSSSQALEKRASECGVFSLDAGCASDADEFSILNGSGIGDSLLDSSAPVASSSLNNNDLSLEPYQIEEPADVVDVTDYATGDLIDDLDIPYIDYWEVPYIIDPTPNIPSGGYILEPLCPPPSNPSSSAPLYPGDDPSSTYSCEEYGNVCAVYDANGKPTGVSHMVMCSSGPTYNEDCVMCDSALANCKTDVWFNKQDLPSPTLGTRGQEWSHCN